MTKRIKENQVKGLLILFVVALLMMQVFISHAQSRNVAENIYRGFFASFGTRNAMLTSNIDKLNQTRLLQTGGQLGVILGNSILKSRIGLIGYYSSTGKTPGTTDLYVSNANANFYPLAWLSDRKSIIEPYATGGISYDRYKFFGYYINREPGVTNYSQAEAPYLGTIRQMNATIGLGIEVRLRDDDGFIHLFSEAKMGRPLSINATDPAFEQTTLTDQMQVSVGISFGGH